MPKRKVKVDGHRIVKSFSCLFIGAKHYSELATKSKEGRFYPMVTCLLCAFVLEAYLNDLGEKRMKCWNTIERTLSPKGKLLLLSELLKYEIDFTKRPFKIFGDIFSFRNSLVHAKTETLRYESPQYLNEEEAIEDPETKWEKSSNSKNAEKFLINTEKMIRILHKKAGYRNDPFRVTSKFNYGTL